MSLRDLHSKIQKRKLLSVKISSISPTHPITTPGTHPIHSGQFKLNTSIILRLKNYLMLWRMTPVTSPLGVRSCKICYHVHLFSWLRQAVWCKTQAVLWVLLRMPPAWPARVLGIPTLRILSLNQGTSTEGHCSDLNTFLGGVWR